MQNVSTPIEARDALLADLKDSTSAQRRRVAEVRAREHVGAAGWAQSSTLEDIVRTGRQGLAATDALQQVVHLTSEQLRTLPLGAPGEQREDHALALENIVRHGQEQITAAQALDELLCQALDHVSRTPLHELNVQRLLLVHDHVRDQVTALNTIIESARAQAATLEQLGALERISAEHLQRVQDLRQLGSEEEAQALGEAGEQIVTRLASLEDAAPQQLDALKRIGEAVVEQLPETALDVQTQAEALEELSRAAHEKSEALRGATSDA
ncbi:hypothetical protein [Deinococcus hohokamensis]|uniref:Uncharacterized protein n=1 Tax=Deinococcus hohokamensis TaxID=309883 RepID=A0ABV9IBI0_9DEIO